MPLKSKIDRNQIQFLTLDQLVEPDSIVRVIDLFCKCIRYEYLGFKVKGKSHEGKPAFHTETLTAIYIYGYLHKIRSCRLLEKACKVNSELWWLTNMQKPGYKTIADFRKDNPEAFKNLFNTFTKFCLDLELFGKTTIAIDGSKFRAQNSKKNNFNLKKVNQHLEYIAQQKDDYLKSLEQNDNLENQKQLDAKLQNLEIRKDKYTKLKEELAQSDQTQISTTDPDARALPLHMSIVQMAYNLQSAVDDKHNLIADFEVTNQNDFSALAPVAIKAKGSLNLTIEDELTALADKGYYSGKQIDDCSKNNIQTLVSPKSKGSKAKDPRVSKDKFNYNKNNDAYTCPKGIQLNRQGKVYKRKDGVEFTRYVANWSKCQTCPWVDICVSPSCQKAKRGRMINRSIYDQALKENDLRVQERKAEYKRRQAIVEHPFGTIKRQWGYDHTLLKGLKKVNGEFAIILLCYNLKRVISILGIKGLKEALISKFKGFLITTTLITQSTKLFQPKYHKLHRADQFSFS